MLGWIPGHFELGVIAVIALLIFGRKLPDATRTLGRTIKEFGAGLREAREYDDDEA
jgi:TatA/E family protein of Tat protein translocase